MKRALLSMSTASLCAVTPVPARFIQMRNTSLNFPDKVSVRHASGTAHLDVVVSSAPWVWDTLFRCIEHQVTLVVCLTYQGAPCTGNNSQL